MLRALMSQSPKMLASATTAFTRMPAWAPQKIPYHSSANKIILGGIICIAILFLTAVNHNGPSFPSLHFRTADPVANATLGVSLAAVDLEGDGVLTVMAVREDLCPVPSWS